MGNTGRKGSTGRLRSGLKADDAGSSLAGLQREATTGGATIIPLRMYLKNGKAKVQIALARGKRKYDKRETIAKREAERAVQRAVRRRQQ